MAKKKPNTKWKPKSFSGPTRKFTDKEFDEQMEQIGKPTKDKAPKMPKD